MLLWQALRPIYDAYICTDKGLGPWKPEFSREHLPQIDFLMVVKVPVFINKSCKNTAKKRVFWTCLTKYSKIGISGPIWMLFAPMCTI